MKLEGKVRIRDWDFIQTPLYPKESLNFKGHRALFLYGDLINPLSLLPPKLPTFYSTHCSQQ